MHYALILLLLLGIAGGCATAAILLLAKQNGGKLTQQDARYGAGCLIFYGRIFVYAIVLYFGAPALVNAIIYSWPDSELKSSLPALCYFLSVIGLMFAERKLLVRSVVYRKLRYLMHFNFGPKR